jgi:hypothetical protein
MGALRTNLPGQRVSKKKRDKRQETLDMRDGTNRLGPAKVRERIKRKEEEEDRKKGLKAKSETT